jgi:hypothetical protein
MFGGALPAGYYRFTNSTGFSIGVPAGWQISHVGHYVYIRDPANSGIFLLIDQSDQPQPNALAAAGGGPAEQLPGLPPHPPAGRVLPTRRASGGLGIQLRPERHNCAYPKPQRAGQRPACVCPLYWSTPESDWNADYHYFTAFAATFRPAGVNQG